MTLLEIIKNARLRKKMEKALAVILEEDGLGAWLVCEMVKQEIVKEALEKGDNIIYQEEKE